jgi:hypothetical protein
MKRLTIFLVLFISISVFSVLSCSNNDEEIFRIVNALIGPEGGTITSSDGRLTLTIPPGALDEDTEITIRRLSDNEIPEEFADENVGSAYELLPEGLEFNLPVTATLKLQTTPLQDDGTLMSAFSFLFISSGNTIELLENTEITMNGIVNTTTVSAELTHFTELVEGTASGITAILDMTMEEDIPNAFPGTITVSSNSSIQAILGDIDRNESGAAIEDPAGFDGLPFSFGGGESIGLIGGQCNAELPTSAYNIRLTINELDIFSAFLLSLSGAEDIGFTDIQLDIISKIVCKDTEDDGFPPPPLVFCGDGAINQFFEDCDLGDFGGVAFGLDCTSFGFDAGVLSCNEDCTIDTSGCFDNPPPPPPPTPSPPPPPPVQPFCGDGVTNQTVNQPFEECDLTDFGGQSCMSLGFESGDLSCNEDCTFDTSGCVEPPTQTGCADIGRIEFEALIESLAGQTNQQVFITPNACDMSKITITNDDNGAVVTDDVPDGIGGGFPTLTGPTISENPMQDPSGILCDLSAFGRDDVAGGNDVGIQALGQFVVTPQGAILFRFFQVSYGIDTPVQDWFGDPFIVNCEPDP